MAGYSAAPLASKLGITADTRLVVLDDPSGVLDGALPDGVTPRRQARGTADIVVVFVAQRARLEARIERLAHMVFPGGVIWVAWPKKAAKVPTDVTEDVVRLVALPLGLVDTKVCAIDDVWSGLKLGWRTERRRPTRR